MATQGKRPDGPGPERGQGQPERPRPSRAEGRAGGRTEGQVKRQAEGQTKGRAEGQTKEQAGKKKSAQTAETAQNTPEAPPAADGSTARARSTKQPARRTAQGTPTAPRTGRGAPKTASGRTNGKAADDDSLTTAKADPSRTTAKTNPHRTTTKTDPDRTTTKTAPAPPKRGVGRPRRISPEVIVDTARRIIHEEGVDALSMRRVAKEVGATPMALYHHVRDKDELLMLTLSGTAAAVPRPELPDDPRDRMLAVALHLHGLLCDMPWVVEVLNLGDLTDKDGLWMIEEIVDASLDCGLSPAGAVHMYRTVWHFIVGDVIFRRAMDRRAAQPDRKRYFPDMLTEADAAELPRLVELSDRWTRLTLDDYDVSRQLGAIIDGLLAAGPRSAP